ncbi:MAG: histidine phosphatase family protein, partial [Actinomycetota bacterium]
DPGREVGLRLRAGDDVPPLLLEHPHRQRGVERIAAAHPDQRVAVFAHGGVIGQILSHATGARGFAFSGCDNASISHLVVQGDRWVLRRFNDTTHLDDTLTVAAQPPT